MADFRKSLLLAAMALAVGVGTASAQTGSCTGTAGAPPILRSQGITELTGLITLTCTGLPTSSFQINITDFVNVTAVTSRVDEAYAVVSTSAATFGTPYYGTVTGSTVTFNGITIPAGGTAQIILGGIRVNATGVTGASGNTATPITSQLAISNSNISLQSNVFVVGLVTNAGTYAVTPGALSVSACATSVTAVSPPQAVAYVAISEAFATAFKTQWPASTGSPDSETGPYNNGSFPNGPVNIPNTSPGVPADPATSGTQLAVTFTGVPSGITFYIPVTVNSNAGGSIALVTTPGGTTWVTPVSSPPAGLPASLYGWYAISANTTVYYNVVQANPSATETYTIPVYPNGNLSGTPSVSVSLAPNSSSDVPDFATSPLTITGSDTSGSLVPTTSTTACQTSLLFPFVTNQAGFDTGISIAYTGSDPFGTTVSTTGGVPAVCTLYSYGSGGGTSQPLDIPTYGEGHTTISAAFPGFQGYLIAVCNFELAHGFAFITDGFMGPGRGLSEGYLPLVLGPTRSGASTPVNGQSPAGPESLTE
jgi:hypothetical protein